MPQDIITLDRNHDLVYSPDDNGWYVQRSPDQTCSDVYPTMLAAREAWQNDNLTYN